MSSAEYQRAWHAAHPEKRAEYMARYRLSHPQVFADYNSARRTGRRIPAMTPDERRKRRAERALIKRLADPDGYRRRNRDRMRSAARLAWNVGNRGRHAELNRRWRQSRRAASSGVRLERKRLILELRLARRIWKLSQPDKRRKLDGLTRDQRQTLKNTGGQTAIAYGRCAYRSCGRLFVHRAAILTRYCQPSHAHRAGKHAWHPIGVTRRQIYERDGWRCHSCLKLVPDRRYRGRDLDPTCDHLIPVADGGTDLPVNLALAHNKCNWDRGAGGIAQLRLIA